MSYFNEENTVEKMVLDTLCGDVSSDRVAEDTARYGDEKIFLEDGNAFVVKFDVLIELTKYCYQEHPNLRKLSSYAHVKDILQKPDDD